MYLILCDCRNETIIEEDNKLVRCPVCGALLAEPSEDGIVIKKPAKRFFNLDESEFLEDLKKCENCGKIDKLFLARKVPTHFVCRNCWRLK